MAFGKGVARHSLQLEFSLVQSYAGLSPSWEDCLESLWKPRHSEWRTSFGPGVSCPVAPWLISNTV